MDQMIVYRVIRTLTIIQGSNLDFFQKKMKGHTVVTNREDYEILHLNVRL